jgi:hypothetical protein
MEESCVIRRLLHRLISASVVASLALPLVGAAAVVAKTPDWSIAVVRIPDTVQPGKLAAFKVTVTMGRSNIPKAFLTDSRLETPDMVIPDTGCAASGQLNCALGALKRGESATRTVVYKTPTSGTGFPVEFEVNTSGVSYSDGGTSHGDALLSGVISTALNSNANFAGGYVADAGESVETGSGDVQQTTVNPPTNGIGVTIVESGSGNPCGARHTIGQLAEINVADGTRYATPFLTTFRIPTSSVYDELELGDINLCHQYDSGTAAKLARCAADAAPTNGVACFWPKWEGPYHPDFEFHHETDADDWTWLVIDIWDFENGGLRGGW